MAHLDIHLFETFRATLAGRQLSNFESDKGRALLAYLALENDRPHRRQTLTGLLWPNWSETDARHCLRQTLYKLRQLLTDNQNPTPYLLVTSQAIQFNPASNYWLDAIEFTALICTVQNHHPRSTSLCPACQERLNAAVDLYQGDLLTGFSLPDCPEFGWWLLFHQETYHRQALAILDQLGSYYEGVHDYYRAGVYAYKEISLEPWRERAHRRYMRILALNGDHNAALNHYKHCRHLLSQELGIEPSAKTKWLHEQIRDKNREFTKET